MFENLRGLLRSHSASAAIFFLRYRNENRRNRSRTGVRPWDGDRRSFTLLPPGGVVEAHVDEFRNMSRSIIATSYGEAFTPLTVTNTLCAMVATSHNVASKPVYDSTYTLINIYAPPSGNAMEIDTCSRHGFVRRLSSSPNRSL